MAIGQTPLDPKVIISVCSNDPTLVPYIYYSDVTYPATNRGIIVLEIPNLVLGIKPLLSCSSSSKLVFKISSDWVNPFQIYRPAIPLASLVFDVNCLFGGHNQ